MFFCGDEFTLRRWKSASARGTVTRRSLYDNVDLETLSDQRTPGIEFVLLSSLHVYSQAHPKQSILCEVMMLRKEYVLVHACGACIDPPVSAPLLCLCGAPRTRTRCSHLSSSSDPTPAIAATSSMASQTERERQCVYLTYRDLFCGSKARVRNRKIIRSIILKHWGQSGNNVHEQQSNMSPVEDVMTSPQCMYQTRVSSQVWL
jgi:hypothetical protein